MKMEIEVIEKMLLANKIKQSIKKVILEELKKRDSEIKTYEEIDPEYKLFKLKKEFNKNLRTPDNRCPLCTRKLQKHHNGKVCANPNCGFYFRFNGWVYQTKEKHPNYYKYESFFKIYESLYDKEFLNLKKEIREKYNNVCAVCESKESLQVHHILPRSKEPIMSLDKDNLILLCKTCHKKVHSTDRHKFGKLND